MTPTAEDREAMARLFGLGEPDPRMLLKGEPLPGVTKCAHPMTGGGALLLGRSDSIGVIEEWKSHPYYHHQYVPTEIVGGHTYCNCGNPEAANIHMHCWEKVYGMPMVQWVVSGGRGGAGKSHSS